MWPFADTNILGVHNEAQGLPEVEPAAILDLTGSNQISLIPSFPLELCYSLPSQNSPYGSGAKDRRAIHGCR